MENLAFKVNASQLGQVLANTAERSRKASFGKRARRLLPATVFYLPWSGSNGWF